ncbi:MAG: hypothetical protein ACE5JI_09420 [Acidobacteriota bacterium]
MRRARNLFWAWVGAAVWVSAAAASVEAGKKGGREELAWPLGNPRVRLERVIQQRDDLRSGMAKFLSRLGGGKRAALFQRPHGVAWDGDDLLITDPGARRVVRISGRGRVTTSRQGVIGNPIGVAACSQGVVVSDARTGKVALLGPGLGNVRWIAEGLARPTGVACSGPKIFIVETGNHRVLVREPDGSWSSLGERGAEEGRFNFPTSVAVANGSLWVGDTLNFRIQRLDATSGSFEETFGKLGDAPGEMPRIKGIAVDSAGHLWVSDAYLDRISLYGPEGTFLMSLGGTGGEPGEFSFPAGIATHPDGRIAVVDSLNRRVQVFRLVAPDEGRP